MKKLFVLVALIAYAFADKCDDCLKACEGGGLIGLLKRNACKSDCILGPCLE